MTVFWLFSVVTNSVLGNVGVLKQVTKRQFLETTSEITTPWSVGVKEAIKSKHDNIVFSSEFTAQQVRRMIAQQQEDNAYSVLADVVIVNDAHSEVAKTFDDSSKTFIVGLGQLFTDNKASFAAVYSL